MASRKLLAPLLAAALAGCSSPERESAPDPPRPPAAQVSGPTGEPSPPIALRAGLRPGTRLRLRQERAVQELPREELELELTWSEVDAEGRGQSGVLRVVRSIRHEGQEVFVSPDQGLQLRIECRDGRPRLFPAEEASATDLTAKYPTFAALLGPASGRSPLLPAEPVRAGERWQVPLRQYLAATRLPAARSFGGTVSAVLRGVDPGSAAIAYEVDLRTPASMRPPRAVRFTGEVTLDRELGIPLRTTTSGVIVQGEKERSFEMVQEVELQSP